MATEDLKLRAIQIRDEVQEGRNTANRVGQLLLDMIENNGTDPDILDGRFIRKDIDDFADGNLTFNRNLEVIGLATFHMSSVLGAIYSNEFGDKYGTKGFYLPATGPVWFDEMRVKGNSQFDGALSSPNFVSGFPNGIGFMLAPYERMNAAMVPEKKYKLEIDDLTVRGKFRVFEMIYSQLRGENDNVIFAGMMKVDHIDAETNTIYLDTEEGLLYNPFRAGDILMVQRIMGLPTAENDYNVVKQYELKIVEAGIGSLADKEKRVDFIRYENFVGELTDVATGDVLTRVDSVTDSTRKGIIKITTIDEFGAPYIDVVYGMKTDPLNATKMRAGRLDGLVTPFWGRLEGYGLMCVNAYLRGKFMLQNGEDVLTKFNITEGLIYSEISAFRVEVSEKYNYLSNASFALNTDKWEAVNNIKLFTIAGKFLYFNDNFYSEKKNIAAVVIEGTRRALRLKNASIKQLNANLANRPAAELPLEDGTTTWPEFYVSFKYKCTKAGTLKIGFEGKPLFLSENISENEVFETKEFSAIWDGTGDFKISFTGDIYIYSITLTDNPLENYRIETETRFYQTAEQIGMWAKKTDKIEGITVQLGIDINATTEQLNVYANKTNALEGTTTNLGLRLNAAEGKLNLYADKTNTLTGTVTQLGIDLDATNRNLSLYVKDKDLTGAELVSRIEMAPSWITISASRVNLQGAVTFSSLASSLQNTINGKANTSTLGDLAFYDKVKQAMTDETIIVGGYINTSLIKAQEILAQQAKIGGFSIANGRLIWEQSNGFGGTAKSLKLGSGTAKEGVVNVYFDMSTDGPYGIRSVGRAAGGACIFASANYTPVNYPKSGMTYAGFFDGNVDVIGESISNICSSLQFRAIASRNSNGTYNYRNGVSFGTNYDLDDVRLEVKNGIIVGLYTDKGNPIITG
ncbi:hypothetical protein [Parabacteroides sp.]|uniref:hypothetical protein n=1 Tax=Parabacteroides sp. TaxID=1869337 RepID=UPI003080E193